MTTNPQDHGVDEALDRATAEANKVFGEIAATVERQVKGGATRIDVLKVVSDCGIPITAADLDELQIEPTVHVLTFLPWRLWFPWRPLWCWWWRRFHRFYWYRCCPYWWHRCRRCRCC